MLNWALRETVTKLLFRQAMLPGPGFYAVSYSLLAIVYLVAILVPSGEAVGGWGGNRQLPPVVYLHVAVLRIPHAGSAPRPASHHPASAGSLPFIPTWPEHCTPASPPRPAPACSAPQCGPR
jgi:hypothetical protein